MSLKRLLQERELQLVLSRYARLCDERDWTLIDQVFSAHATANYGGRAVPDRAAIQTMLRNNLGGCGSTQHLLSNWRSKSRSSRGGRASSAAASPCAPRIAARARKCRHL